ncbi:HAUS augmin-like complex subunit 7 [Megalops cyprinoides]|uniref:HAUS augmin-like complex subunit 7 n=1 Tax=Megalops cyprinoides TaxID=118141 RepID=UPI0018641521|nr:HAUS augmin-like complex subunit 7 [Megalops cyprinoides]
MAGTLKEKELAERLYSTLQVLGCPLVEGLFLQGADSMEDLLCTPSLHRTDILKWICASCCPSLKDKFSTLRSTQADAMNQEMVRFGHDLMLCKLDDLDLIKGLAPPLQQLQFLEQLLALIPEKCTERSIVEPSPSGVELSVAEVVQRNEKLLGELMSPIHMPELLQLLFPSCCPWSADLREILRCKASQSKMGQQRSGCVKPEDHAVPVRALLQSTRDTVEELQNECIFLQSNAASPSPALSPCALRLVISDLSHLMLAFSQSFNTEFRGYCHRKPPALSPNSSSFCTVHQLLHTCNQELRALQQLSDTSSTMVTALTQVQMERMYWGEGQKHTLPTKLEELKKKYTDFLSLHQQ